MLIYIDISSLKMHLPRHLLVHGLNFLSVSKNLDDMQNFYVWLTSHDEYAYHIHIVSFPIRAHAVERYPRSSERTL
jgi:hypothetical protein